jgi:phosphatidylglycerol---prolipoprotein diacylglyceryl transferase
MTFHWYGFIVGLAVSVVVWGLDYHLQRSSNTVKYALSNRQLIALLLIILAGARLWHIATDWQLYGQLSWQLLAVWQGGLSILGAIVAAVVGVWWLVPMKSQRLWLLDTLVLWLPIGQAVGRLANWVNQELYGLPTTVPWGIYINSDRRLPGYEFFDYYHPLFAYEAIGLLLLA